MRITKNTTETAAGPNEWFTGAVYIDTVATPTLGAVPPRGHKRPLHPRRAYRVAHPPPRPNHLRHRGSGPLPAPGRKDRGDPPGGPGVLRAGRGALLRRRP